MISEADTSSHKRELVESSAAIAPFDLGEESPAARTTTDELSPDSRRGGSQRLWQLHQPPIDVLNGFQIVDRGPPRGPQGFRVTKGCALTPNLCDHTSGLKKNPVNNNNKYKAPGFHLLKLE